MKFRLKNGISYLILLSIFIIGVPFSIGFDFYWYYPIYLLFLTGCLAVNRKISWSLIITLFAITIYSVTTFKYALPLVIKQLINIIFSALVFYNFLVFEDFDLKEIFRKYIALAKIILLLGILQVFLFFINQGTLFTLVFPWLGAANIGVRLQSLCQEPSYIALTFSPIVYFALTNIFNRQSFFLSRKWSFLFLIGFLLTQSSLAYISILVSLVYIYFNRLTLFRLLFAAFTLFIIGLLGYLLYLNINAFRIRVDDTYKGFTSDFTNAKIYKSVNLSTYALLSNYYVTKKSIEANPLAGSGLGTHQASYEKYLPSSMQSYKILNSEDANSMMLRLLSETGIIGIVIFLWFVIKYNIRHKRYFKNDQQELWLINSGLLILIIVVLLRNGNYTVQGRLLFFLMYYYSCKAFKLSPQEPHEK